MTMSLRTRINGFTAWVNLRLAPSGHFMHNILTDLLKGYNMKVLLESLTGRPLNKLQSFDGLTQQQRMTRVEWIVSELKHEKVIPKEIYIDSRMFAMRCAEQVFDLLWSLVCHDIWFIWERSEFLREAEGKTLVSKPFSWTPPPPPPKTSVKMEKSLLSGLGSRSIIVSPMESPEQNCSSAADTQASDEMVNRRRHTKNYPPPDYCILELVNAHLKMTREGRKFTRGVMSLEDLTDSRVLCALINSFVPDTFTTEVLLNDRWTINLALKTANQMFKSSNPFESQDLVEGDIMSVCAYFAFFFMCGYKFNQSRAMLKRLDELNVLKIGIKDELDKFPTIVTVMKDLKRQKELESQLQEHDEEIRLMEQNYDVNRCAAWVKEVMDVQNKCRLTVAEKIVERFDIVQVPRNVTINELTASMVINLSLTCGTGFYSSNATEVIWKNRKLVIKDKETGQFYDDFSGNPEQKLSIREILGLEHDKVVEINGSNYPTLEIFYESTSRNKMLKAGTLFLYQVFPGATLQCQRLLFKAAKSGELDTVQKLVAFFQTDQSFITSKEHGSGNTALHLACRHGHFNVCRFLLENGSDVDAVNNHGNTPFFMATESLQKDIGQLLIEWGSDVHKRNNNSKTAFDMMRHYELRQYFQGKFEEWQERVPKLISGDVQLLTQILEEHYTRENRLASLNSRCVRGSTLLHTAAFFGAISAIKTLLGERVDVNLLDYKGATPLHRAKDSATVDILLEAGAKIDAMDHDGNTPLHVKCYGERGQTTELECIEKMLIQGAALSSRNKRNLMPVHCAAMQGRIDAIQALLFFDTDEKIRMALDCEDQNSPPSLIHLAVANDFLECAQWLSQNHFELKEKESDLLVHKILLEEIPCTNRLQTVKFLLDQGASLNPIYNAGNTALHLTAGLSNASEVLKLFLSYDADVDAVNDDVCTPLFYATQGNNMYAASLLIQHGANVRARNFQGLTAFDFIADFEEWIDSGYFTEEIKARLRAYSLKHARDLVRAISKKVKGQSPLPQQTRLRQVQAALTVGSTGQVPLALPPIKNGLRY